jgi:hypothetical protein
MLQSTLLSIAMTTFGVTTAQKFPINANRPMLRTMSKEWVVGLYATMLEQNATDNSARMFAEALRDRADNSGVPSHVYEAIINELTPARSVQCGEGGCLVPLSLQKIWNYGCWCNMGANLLKGVGIVIDDYDQACQNMQRCLRCAQLDGEFGGYSCEPKSTTYSATMQFNGNSMIANCDSLNNGNPCGTSLCTCETQFISEVMDNLWNGAVYSSDNLHSQGFDKDTSCIHGVSGQPVFECCGLYPKRFPYNVNQQDCCTDDVTYGKAYNPTTQECCDGKSVADAASCA